MTFDSTLKEKKKKKGKNMTSVLLERQNIIYFWISRRTKVNFTFFSIEENEILISTQEFSRTSSL